MSNSLSAAHISANLAGYEAARTRFFSLIVDDIDNIVKASYSGERQSAADSDKIARAQETLKLNVIVPPPEGFTTETIADPLYKNLQYQWQYNTVDNNIWREIRPEMISATDPAKPVVSVNADGSLTVRRASNIPVIQFRCVVTNTLGNKDNSATKTQELIYTIV
jgi:hypothetical protein